MGLDFDFSKLDPQDVLDIAIYIEREAEENYEQLVSWFENESAESAAFFRRMAALEGRHREQLEAQRSELFGDAPVQQKDAGPWEVEVPDYAAIGSSVTLREALEIAHKAETAAHDYYAAAMEYAADPKVEELFDGLRRSEREHQRLLEVELEKL